MAKAMRLLTAHPGIRFRDRITRALGEQIDARTKCRYLKGSTVSQARSPRAERTAMRNKLVSMMLVVVGLMFVVHWAFAEDATTDPVAAATTTATKESAAEANDTATATRPTPRRPEPRKLPEPKGARRLAPDSDVWVDPKEGVVIVDGMVCLREGMLEMFACTRNSKEHESIVSVNSKAFLVHTGLLALGAVAGHPVQFVPEYKPPTGTEIEVLVQYTNEDGNEETVRAQEWIKDIRTNKPMEYPFVFGGSLFWTDPDTGKKYYQAERGDFICVSNFGTAMLDIPVKSSAENDDLAFQTFTDKIPPLWTPVRLILKPNLKKDDAGNKEQRLGSSDQKADTTKQPEKNVER